jgi:hypothetical protein
MQRDSAKFQESEDDSITEEEEEDASDYTIGTCKIDHDD